MAFRAPASDSDSEDERELELDRQALERLTRPAKRRRLLELVQQDLVHLARSADFHSGLSNVCFERGSRGHDRGRGPDSGDVYILQQIMIAPTPDPHASSVSSTTTSARIVQVPDPTIGHPVNQPNPLDIATMPVFTAADASSREFIKPQSTIDSSVAFGKSSLGPSSSNSFLGFRKRKSPDDVRMESPDPTSSVGNRGASSDKSSGSDPSQVPAIRPMIRRAIFGNVVLASKAPEPELATVTPTVIPSSATVSAEKPPSSPPLGGTPAVQPRLAAVPPADADPSSPNEARIPDKSQATTEESKSTEAVSTVPHPISSNPPAGTTESTSKLSTATLPLKNAVDVPVPPPLISARPLLPVVSERSSSNEMKLQVPNRSQSTNAAKGIEASTIFSRVVNPNPLPAGSILKSSTATTSVGKNAATASASTSTTSNRPTLPSSPVAFGCHLPTGPPRTSTERLLYESLELRYDHLRRQYDRLDQAYQIQRTRHQEQMVAFEEFRKSVMDTIQGKIQNSEGTPPI